MPETKTLTDVQRQLLARLEAAVDRGLAGTEEALAALLEIHRRGLYRAVSGDWWGYVRFRWPKSERHISRLLARAEVARNVAGGAAESGPAKSGNDPLGQKSTAPVPNERQARELARLRSPEAQREVWRAVLVRAKAAGKRVTAKMLRDGVDQYLQALAPEDPAIERIRAAQEEARRRSAKMVDYDTVNDFQKKLQAAGKRLARRFGERARAALAAVEQAIVLAEALAG